MKKLEAILCVLILTGLILKFALIPGAGTITTFSLLLLGTFYYLFGFALFNKIGFRQIFKRDSYKDTNALRIIGAVLTGWAVSIIFIGVLFTVQHYPGAAFFLYCGLVCIILIFIVALIRYLKSKEEYYIRIFKYLAVSAVIGLLFLFVPESSVIELQYRNHPEYIEAYKDLKADPQNEELKKKEKTEYRRATMTKEEFEYYEKGKEKDKK